MLIVDVVVLTALLAITGYAIFKNRSRAVIVVVSLFSLIYFGFLKHGCVCSVGSIQNIILSIADKTYKVPITTVLLFVIPIITALFWGRLFCAGACPLGALQDAISIWRIRIPRSLEKTLEMFPPLYLAATLVFILTKKVFLICQYDPFVSIFRMDGTIETVLLTVAVLLVVMFVPRAYCRFVCPYGYLLKLASFVSPKQIKISSDECRSCRLCYEVCPVEAIEPATPIVDSATSVKRVKLLLKLMPVWIILFSWSGVRLINFLSLNGDHTHNLIKSPNLFGIILGSILALFWGSTLIYQSRGVTYKEAFPHKSNCIRCGRCYNYCPVVGESEGVK